MSSNERDLYTTRFFHGRAEGSLRSARRVAPLLVEWIKPTSVLDVGCGTGAWLRAFLDAGVTEVLGVDGDYVDRTALLISTEQFLPRDLKQPLDLGRKFDLACSLEVAEHLPPACSQAFVESLVRHAPIVLFSAAIPGQVGNGHINCRWPRFWIELFARFEYVAIDCLRSRCWDDPDVEPWYAQNMFLFARSDEIARHPQLVVERERVAHPPPDLVHPKVFAHSLEQLDFDLRLELAKPTPEQLKLAATVPAMLERYAKNPLDQATVAAIRAARIELANVWLCASADDLKVMYGGPLGGTQRALAFGALRHEPVTDLERGVIKGIADPKCIAAILAAMLLMPAYEVEPVLEVTQVPPWLLHDYVRWCAQPPSVFHEVGEAARYANFAEAWWRHLAANVATEKGISTFSQKMYLYPFSPGGEDAGVWHAVARVAAPFRGAEALCCDDANICATMAHAGKVLETALELSGHRPFAELPKRPATNRLRVGVIADSPATWVNHLDPSRFEVRLHNVENDLSGQAESLRAEGLDVLIFASDVTALGSRAAMIAAHRLAAVQIALGSPVTTGLRNVDVFISGAAVEPPDAQDQYTERLIQLEGSGLCWSSPAESEPTRRLSRESLKLPPDTVLFVSGAPASSITPEARVAWAEILARVPGSVLVLSPSPAGWAAGYPNHLVLSDLRARMQARGVAPNRLGAAGASTTRADALEVIKLADVCLDTFPVSSALAAADALSSGVPVVILRGATRRARLAFALLRDVTAEELAADDVASYVEIAVALASDSARRQSLRERLGARAASTGWYDAPAFARKVEHVLDQSCPPWCDLPKPTLP
jgi:SAM-dependent methyltransferase